MFVGTGFGWLKDCTLDSERRKKYNIWFEVCVYSNATEVRCARLKSARLFFPSITGLSAVEANQSVIIFVISFIAASYLWHAYIFFLLASNCPQEYSYGHDDSGQASGNEEGID